jgi:phosphatidate phosphatase APP1
VRYIFSSLLTTDIDDTVKVSEVLRELHLLYNTFILEKPVAVNGMPEFYQRLKELYNPSFFYLSASPWQLYLFIKQFLNDNAYPHGTVIMREMTFREFSSFYHSWLLSPKDYKIDRMRKIHSWFPNRKFICIGDSTQSDPEAYGEMYVNLR